ncbi:hypothetical protein CANTEDRAFT_127098 [Yamadazyma tenuis ATCC 10573]|uniref:Ceramide glucosyltransferase n=1 Tax=Candida tenuis (strain ATCC 10573 / BCRC 21748 / CBS 615 / JCM 9827 / NBRC 10315 / NRRL Y-1498 / VKM Y-70) TaxID=590646 RepID=G3BCA3_CANTC|nr:uncharacterized protein CANTEDRAFT_127098 [Yamadazyma tenuis ATCC 10573]EGV60153.1 hypothetical protein CANTEDRAFT_127098 [Yamadazyma tenuis ATCC 10573]
MIDLWSCVCVVLLLWYAAILMVAVVGVTELLFNYTTQKFFTLDKSEYEPVTILRPIKGIDPELETCLECSFQQAYAVNALEVILCVDSAADESMPILKRLIAKYPEVDAKILVSPTDNHGNSVDHFGPNPKVNNLAKGFLAAKYDIVWIMDSNVWGHPNLLVNSIKSLNHNLVDGGRTNWTWGPSAGRKVKLVHHVPLAMSITAQSSLWDKLGVKLDETFLFSSHCKFYVGLNKLSPAPCVNGKSNMFRRSDLDEAVARIPNANNPFFSDPSVKLHAQQLASEGPGHSLKFFSKYIGEDNMIAIALWEFLFSRTSLTSDVVIQPLNKSETSKHGIVEFFKRRIRWLRVRKYMVYSATLVEPTTESIVNGVFGTLSISYLMFGEVFIKKFFMLHMILWYLSDTCQYRMLMSRIESYARPVWFSCQFNWYEWTCVWMLREVFALPIWIIAMLGHEIDWRGRPFRIKPDLTAEEL